MLHDVGSRPIQESNLPTVPLLIMTVSLFTRCPAKSLKCPAILYECRKNCTEFPGKMHYGISLLSASVLSYRAVHPYFGKCIMCRMLADQPPAHLFKHCVHLKIPKVVRPEKSRETDHSSSQTSKEASVGIYISLLDITVYK